MAKFLESVKSTLWQHKSEDSTNTFRNRKSTVLQVARSIQKNFPCPPKLQNLKWKHIAPAVRDLQKNVSSSTLPNKLSDIHWFLKLQEVRRGFIMPSNKEIGLDRRIRTTHTDKSIHDPGKYFIRLSELPLRSKYDKMIGRNRQVIILQLQKQFGLRLEEACKFHPGRDIHEKTIDVISGTKNNRPRKGIPIRTDAQRNILNDVLRFRTGTGSLIPSNMKADPFINKMHHDLAIVGFSRKGEAGCSTHALRHLYAHDRFESVAGIRPLVEFPDKEAYHIAATESIMRREDVHNRGEAETKLSELEREGYETVNRELGHSEDRWDITGVYLK